MKIYSCKHYKILLQHTHACGHARSWSFIKLCVKVSNVVPNWHSKIFASWKVSAYTSLTQVCARAHTHTHTHTHNTHAYIHTHTHIHTQHTHTHTHTHHTQAYIHTVCVGVWVGVCLDMASASVYTMLWVDWCTNTVMFVVCIIMQSRHSCFWYPECCQYSWTRVLCQYNAPYSTVGLGCSVSTMHLTVQLD